jgi:hypothetical protein
MYATLFETAKTMTRVVKKHSCIVQRVVHEGTWSTILVNDIVAQIYWTRSDEQFMGMRPS